MTTYKLRVYNIINPPFGEPDFYDVASTDEAKALILRLTKEQLRDKRIAVNIFGLEEQLPMGEWVEWFDENDRSIDDLLEEEDA